MPTHWKIIAKLLLTVHLFACAHSFQIEETTFIVREGALPWDDLPEVLLAMKEVPEAPIGLFQVTVFLEAPYKYIGMKRAICLYMPDQDIIIARTTELSAYEGCLAHEFAHRWVALEGLLVDTHGKEWKERFEKLKKASCKGSWGAGVNCAAE